MIRYDKKQIIDEVCNFLNEVLVTDHSESMVGLDAIFPDIIMCEKYYTVDQLINALKERLGYEEG